MVDQFDRAANDLLQYPKNFTEFLAVVDLFGRAREVVRKPGEDFNEALLRTTDEIDAALAIFREVWANAEKGAASPHGETPSSPSEQTTATDGGKENGPVDTEAIPEDERDWLLGEARKCGYRYDGNEFVQRGSLDSNELLNLMTGVPLPARYGTKWPQRSAAMSSEQTTEREAPSKDACAECSGTDGKPWCELTQSEWCGRSNPGMVKAAASGVEGRKP